jgi:hypothetical protein
MRFASGLQQRRDSNGNVELPVLARQLVWWKIAMKTLRIVTLAIAIPFVTAHTSAAETGQAYSFVVDGRPIQPTVISLRGTPDQPGPGDLVEIAGIWLTLGPERTQQFRTTPREDGRLLAVLPTGVTRVVGARVSWTFKGDKRVTYSPFTRLTAAEIKELRGVYLDEWTDQIGQRLEHVDPHHACITITGDTARKTGGTMPVLPNEIEYLRIEERSNVRGIKDYGRLLEHKALKLLVINSMTGPVDCACLKNAQGLEYLSLHAWKAKNFEQLEHLKALRHLELAYNRDLKDIAFVRGMTQLETLDSRRTGIKDLNSLSGLKKLKTVRVSKSPVATIPASGELPALRSLDIMSTALDDDDVKAFAKAHPQCVVLFRWDQALADALKEADRIRVRSGGTCHRDIQAEKTLIEEKDPAKVRQLIGKIQINEKGSGFHCFCCGNPSIEFYKKGTLILTLGYHHGRSVRWPEMWPGDGLLTKDSAKVLNEWLAEYKVKAP